MWTENVTFDISGIEDDENTEDIAFVFEVIDHTDDMYLSVTQMFDIRFSKDGGSIEFILTK